MRIVVAVQAKSGSSRGLVHYIAHSKTDSSKEPKTRELFNEYSDQTTVEKSNVFLKTGTSVKRPSNDELHHLVISLKSNDYDRLGGDENEKQRSLKQITRHAMKTFSDMIGADKLSWAAGIHLNTANPHVHIAIQKEYFDKSLEKKTLRRIPTSLLPHYENIDGDKRFVPGVLIDAANQKLAEILHRKETVKERNSRVPEKQQNSPEILRGKSKAADELISSNELDQPKNTDDRDVLARAILAKFYLEKTQANLESLENHGDKRRFKIYDEITARKRSMSLFDLERRAEKSATREIKKLENADPAKKEALRKTLVEAEIGKNADGIKRIKTILHNLIKKENQTLRMRENDYNKAKPLAEKIRQKHRSENTKLPTPNLTFDDIEMLQNWSLRKNDIRAVNYFERVRMELARERGVPARTGVQIARIKAQKVVSQLKVLAFEKRLNDFNGRKHTFPVEIEGKKWSLLKVDSFAQKQQKDDRTFTGKLRKLAGKVGLGNQSINREKLEETRVLIRKSLDEKLEQMVKELEQEKSTSKTLNKLLKSGANSATENIEPKYNAAELSEIESLAIELRNPDVYRENWEQQKLFAGQTEKSAESKTSSKAESNQEILAGRAVARSIVCDIELARAKEELFLFKKHKDFQKFEIPTGKNGDTKLVSLKEVAFDSRGSIFDQTLEFFMDNREKRRMRSDIEKILKDKTLDLKENLKAAKIFSKTAAEESRDYIAKSLFGKVRFIHEPLFTPIELLSIELRINQTQNKSEASKLQKLLDSADHFNAKNLSAILEDLSSVIEQEPTKHFSAKEPKTDDFERAKSVRKNRSENHDQQRGK